MGPAGGGEVREERSGLRGRGEHSVGQAHLVGIHHKKPVGVEGAAERGKIGRSGGEERLRVGAAGAEGGKRRGQPCGQQRAEGFRLRGGNDEARQHRRLRAGAVAGVEGRRFGQGQAGGRKEAGVVDEAGEERMHGREVKNAAPPPLRDTGATGATVGALILPAFPSRSRGTTLSGELARRRGGTAF